MSMPRCTNGPVFLRFSNAQKALARLADEEKSSGERRTSVAPFE